MWIRTSPPIDGDGSEPGPYRLQFLAATAYGFVDIHLDGQRILITGGAGFVGSALVARGLALRAERVIVFDSLTYSACPKNLEYARLDPRFRLVEGDVRSSRQLTSLLAEERITRIFHLAAETHVDRSLEDPSVFVRSNVQGTESLLRAALAYFDSLSPEQAAGFRLVHSSTDEVFGSIPAPERFEESSPYHPNSPYAATKAAADHLARAYSHSFGLPVLIAHCGNNYGPRQFPEKLVPRLTLMAAAGEALPLYGDGLQVRDWIHVEDHVEALMAIGAWGLVNHNYCVSASEEHSNREIAEAIRARVAQRLDRNPAPIERVPDRPGHDRRYALDSRRLRNLCGWKPRIPFAEGLVATVDWYLDHPEWVEAALKHADPDGKSPSRRLGLHRPEPSP